MTYTFLKILKLCSNLMSPLGGSYTIVVPTSINLSDVGSFEISISQNNLLDNQTLNISIDNSFVLSDAHGKADIQGYILNNEVSFTSTDSSTKTIDYEVVDGSVGEWSGTLNINISLSDQNTQTHNLTDGKTLNTILKNLNPGTIAFSHDVIENGEPVDVSHEQDSSVLLYDNSGNVIITNNVDEPIVANSSCLSMFANLSNLQYIYNLDYLDTSNCINMAKMFQNCSNLKDVDLSGFDTSNVTNLSYMFENCKELESIGDISTWDVSNVTTTKCLFYYCRKLDGYGDITNWNITDKCKDMSFMFCSMSHTPAQENSSFFPANLDLSTWDVSNVTDMSNMFQDLFSLQTLNIEGWNTSKLKKTANMFLMNDSCITSHLQSVVGIGSLDVASLLDMSHMFSACNSFDGDFSTWQPINILKLDYAFYDCKSLNLSQFNDWDAYFSARTTYTGCFASDNGTLPDAPSWAN